MNAAWHASQRAIDRCRVCEASHVPRLRVPEGAKRHPAGAPPSRVRLLCISVAPPWGGAYFWEESRPDGLRAGLLGLLSQATGEPVGSLAEFRRRGFFLVPAVKCPSEREGRDTAPAARAIENCSGHLLAEISAMAPERIAALGRVPLRAMRVLLGRPRRLRLRDFVGRIETVELAGRRVLLGATCFPGNNRHRGREASLRAIRGLLASRPRSS